MWQTWAYPVAFILLVILPAPWLGRYIYRLMERPAIPGETFLMRCCGIKNVAEQNWRQYLAALLMFNAVGFVILVAILLLQGVLPMNPRHVAAMPFAMAVNTAISFVSNTNWQSYSGEAQLSVLSQMIGLTVQNFVSAASGMAVAIALFRALSRQSGEWLGHFVRDLLRLSLGLLLPLSFILALALIPQGVPQTFHSLISAHPLDAIAHQNLIMGPVASQEAIKQLGTNGGGYYGTNSAFPFENPTALSNWLEMIAILLIPAALVCTFGEYIQNRKHSYTILATMTLLLIVGLVIALSQQLGSDSALAHLTSVKGHWEGIESRFGGVLSTIWATATSAASNGSVNAMLDSFSPLSGMVALTNILTGEVIFGGVGSGIYGMLLFVMLTVFLCGLMVGHTPTYLGKPLNVDIIKWVVLTMLVMPVGVLVIGGASLLLPNIHQLIGTSGPHGLTRLLYAYASTSGNNGSAFAGFNAANTTQEYLLALAMLVGRYGIIIPVMAIAGQFIKERKIETGQVELPIHGVLFAVLLTISIFLIGALAFLPTLVLGPVADFLSGGF
ncbi:potassium-transporting ATPase subunit KdpA [Celerinatantimonas yamalensis]|uniref:Potassium-transporting ATPase potassium-binding subunit n=1 Tax=Celerinatantimonas yamalensis TaxID=559956 RepID=A0ABW9G2R5_9GAMM